MNLNIKVLFLSLGLVCTNFVYASQVDDSIVLQKEELLAQEGLTPLHLAIIHRDKDKFYRYLSFYERDLEVKTTQGYTPLDFTRLLKNQKFEKELQRAFEHQKKIRVIKQKYDEAYNKGDYKAALEIVVFSGYEGSGFHFVQDCLKQIVNNHGVEFDALSCESYKEFCSIGDLKYPLNQGKTGFFSNVTFSNYYRIKKDLKAGNINDALGMAAACGYVKIVKSILDEYQDVITEKILGDAFSPAIDYEQLEVIRLFMIHLKAKRTLIDSQTGITILQMALNNENQEVIDLISQLPE